MSSVLSKKRENGSVLKSILGGCLWLSFIGIVGFAGLFVILLLW